MPTSYAPGCMYNLIGVLVRFLPAAYAGDFRTTFRQQLLQNPHDEQTDADRAEPGDEIIPTSEGTGHLDAVWHWWALAMLVDPEMGVLHLFPAPKEKAALQRIARLYRRWLEGDYPSEEEWEKAGVVDELGEESEAASIVIMASSIGQGMPLLVEQLASSTARQYQGRAIPKWANEPMGEPAGCLVNTLLFPLSLVVSLSRRPGPGNPKHYQMQAHWLLQLMQLRWRTLDPAEQALFQPLVAGNLAGLAQYQDLLKQAGIEPKLNDQMAGTLRRMVQLRAAAA